jgi:hypothetical protein
MSGAQVKTWATSKLGTRVPAGECFDLLDKALRETGHKSAADFGTVTPSANYVWGDSITVGNLAAGDLIQFLAYRINVSVTWEDGATWTGDETRPHHSAIVDSVGAGGEVVILEQNAPPGSVVHRSRIFLSNGTVSTKASQSMSSISQIPPDSAPTADVTVTVSGSLWYYRAVTR